MTETATMERGRFGQFGGRYVPETLIPALDELERVFDEAMADPAFIGELEGLLRDYVGRPSPLSDAPRLSERIGATVYLKREDLNHTGAHKINNAIGQALIARRMGKQRIIAETGAGQHGVATATACARFGLECIVYMGEEDMARQALNVFRMRLLGATVIPVTSGTRTLKDATSEAIRDWVTNIDTTHYIIGSVVGPAPYPRIVRDLQSVIGREARAQMLERAGALPTAVVACVGGGSNAMGIFAPFVGDSGVRLIGVEAAGEGLDTDRHSASLTKGVPGVLHGSLSYLLQDAHGQVHPAHSISAGLDYPGVGPEHSYLHASGRGEYVAVTDGEALRAHQLYLPNNPMHAKALEGVREALTALWRETESARLTVTEGELLVEGAPVLDEGERGGESLSWLLYKDGIRSFEIASGFEEADLGKFLDALRIARNRSADDEDLITLFWEADFSHFTYEYVDVSVDASSAPGAEMLRGGAATPGTVPMPPSHRESTPEQPQFARMDDFDSTLYFLEEAEVEAVQDAIRREFIADPRPAVVDALLDTFERESDAAVRDEICDDLELLVLALMSAGNVASVAYALRELEVAIMRAPVLLPRHRDRVRALLERLSEATVVDQLLSFLEEVTPRPERADVAALLARFGATALTPLLAHAARVREPELRDLLDDAITRLAAANTAELARLIESTDVDVSLEAIRRAGDLRTPAAVAPIAQLLTSGSVEQRRAAIGALGAIATPGAMQILERAIDDEDRALRLLALEAVVARQHRPAVPRIEKAVREWVTRTGTSAEKTAFFDAYVLLAGDTAVATLDTVLNKRDLLRRAEESSTRAAAALALGRLHTERALAALGRATNDKDVVVRTAVSRAMKGSA